MRDYPDPVFLELTLPLRDSFTVSDFSGTEALSELFEYGVTAHCVNTDIDAAQLIGKEVTLQMNYHDTKRAFHGMISEFHAGHISTTAREYTIKFVPKVWLLHFQNDYRIFENQSVPQIVTTLCREVGAKIDDSSLKNSYVERDYCFQYGETGWHFIERLLEEAGIFYYFRQEISQHTCSAQHILVLADDVITLPDCPEQSVSYQTDANTRKTSVQVWEQSQHFYARQFIYNDYHFMQPDASLLALSVNTATLSCANDFSVYIYPDKYTDSDSGNRKAEQGFQAQQARYRMCQGASHCMGFAAGTKVNLSQHPVPSHLGDYFFTRVTHNASDSAHANPYHPDNSQGQTYSNTFSCLSTQVRYYPIPQRVKPKAYGTQTATVVGNGSEDNQEISIDRYGRIRVQFHWDRQGKNIGRIRVAQSWSGQNYGAIFHPRLGQEVMVQFENADPDRPLIVGAVYNSQKMPPYGLTDNLTKSGIKTRSSKQGDANQANELHFNDQKGAEEIYLHAQKDYTRVVQHNDTTVINQGDHAVMVTEGTSTVTAAKAITLDAAGMQILIDDLGVYIMGKPTEQTVVEFFYDLFFTIEQAETGQPLSNINYRIKLEDGQEIKGITDQNGHTEKVSAPTAQAVQIDAPYYENANGDTNTTTTKAQLTPVADQSPVVAPAKYELSGRQWVDRFPGSKSTTDLEPEFQTSVNNFIAALEQAGVEPKIESTYRPPKRAYLMEWSWKIANTDREKYEYVDPRDVPPMEGVNIDWVHPTLEESVQAARDMVKEYKTGGLGTPPSPESRHIKREAIDMQFSWSGTLSIVDANGNTVNITTKPRDEMNAELHKVAESYGVKKARIGKRDRPHWSKTGG